MDKTIAVGLISALLAIPSHAKERDCNASYFASLFEQASGAFIERAESGIEYWTVELPEKLQSYHLNGVRLRRTSGEQITFEAFLDTRSGGARLWSTFAIKEGEHSEFSIHTLYTTKPHAEDACNYTYVIPLMK